MGLDLVEMVETNLVDPSKFNVRSTTNELDSLIASIKSKGLLQPLIVRPMSESFELVAGHRRYEACRRLGYSLIPCIVKELTEKEAFEISLIENIQKETLDPIDEALAFKRYVTESGWGGMTDLAARIGKSEEYVSHRIALIGLPESIRQELRRRLLNPSVAYEMSLIRDPAAQERIAKLAVENKLSVREIRRRAKLMGGALAPFEHNQDTRSDADDSTNLELDEVVLALRMCLLRLDSVVRSVGDGEVDHTVREVRYSVHSLIDRCLRAAKAKEVAGR